MRTISYSPHNDQDQNAKLTETTRKSNATTSPRSVGVLIKMATK